MEVFDISILIFFFFFKFLTTAAVEQSLKTLWIIPQGQKASKDDTTIMFLKYHNF